MTDELIERLRQLLAGFAGENELKVGPHMLAHGIEEAIPALQSLSERIAVLEGENGRLRRCLLPVHMMLAQAECVAEPIPDDAVVLHFMGSGASDQVTAGEVRAASLIKEGRDNG